MNININIPNPKLEFFLKVFAIIAGVMFAVGFWFSIFIVLFDSSAIWAVVWFITGFSAMIASAVTFGEGP